MNINDLNDRIAVLVEEFIAGTDECHDLRSIGLDPRSASLLWVGDNFLAVTRSDDRSLQYYGGFEYVDKGCRTECGEYIFYSVDDNRVYDHHLQFKSGGESICGHCSGSGEGMYDGTRCSSCGGSGVERDEE